MAAMVGLLNIVGWLNAKANTVVRVVAFASLLLLERIRGSRSQSRSHPASDYNSVYKYSFRILRVYDLALLWNNWSAWGVKPRSLQDFFDASVSRKHLDAGVGSGFFPSHSKALQQFSKQGDAVLELWDVNQGPLQFASAQVKKRLGEGLTIRGKEVDLCDKTLVPRFRDGGDLFETATMCYLFHCVPYPAETSSSTTEERAIEKFHTGFSIVESVMAKGGKISGTTLLSSEDPALKLAISSLRLALGRNVMADYQTLKIFHNQYDTLRALEEGAKRAGLKKKIVYIQGYVAHFVYEKA